MEQGFAFIQSFLKKNESWLIPVLLILVVVFGIGFDHYRRTQHPEWFCNKEYTYINSELACTQKQVIKKVAYQDLETRLKNYMNSEMSAGKLQDAGIYFRDLKEGPVFGINENNAFISASLIKLPTVMTVMRLAEQDSTVLQKQVAYEKEIPSDNQDFMPEETMEVGKSYTMDDLIYRSLVYSDNAANELLVDELNKLSPNQNLILTTLHDLGWVVPQSVAQPDISPRRFASLLRLLYNVSFLSKDNSEEILKDLSHSAFEQGITEGVPEGITVADKFGERQLDYVSPSGKAEGHTNELHDCGIIYYPGNPYLLCVMTKGQQFDQLSTIIASISKMVYEEVNSRKL